MTLVHVMGAAVAHEGPTAQVHAQDDDLPFRILTSTLFLLITKQYCCNDRGGLGSKTMENRPTYSSYGTLANRPVTRLTKKKKSSLLALPQHSGMR